MDTLPFTPGVTVTIAASTTTASGALTGTGKSVELYNPHTAIAYVKLGTSTVEAAVTDFPIPPTSRRVITRDPNTQTHIAVILGATTSNFYATVGEGE